MNKKDSGLFEILQGSSVVSGIFAIFIFCVLVWNGFNMLVVRPLKTERLELMKVKSLEIQDEAFLEQVRVLDLEIRQDIFRQWQISKRGTILLVVVLGVFVLSSRWAASLKKTVEMPESGVDIGVAEKKQKQWGQIAVIGGVCVFVVAVIGLSRLGGSEFNVDEVAELPYASMEEMKDEWVHFRGINGDGEYVSGNVAKDFDVPSNKYKGFKIEVELKGYSSPVIWGDMFFITGSDGKRNEVYCYGLDDGVLKWQGGVDVAEEFYVMEDTGYAAPTSATDGRRVYSIFADGQILVMDFDGKMVWKKDLGVPDNMYGHSSSLLCFEGRVIVQFDQGYPGDDIAKVICYNGVDGKTMWEKNRPVGASWASPCLYEREGKWEFVTIGDPWVIAYAADSGDELWRCDGMGADIGASPIYNNGVVYALSPYNELLAITAGGSGDVTGSNIKWSMSDGLPDVCTPVCDGERIYLQGTRGLLTVADVNDGSVVWEHDLGENFQSSPSLIGDEIYLISEKGNVYRVKAGTEFELLGKSVIGERVIASAGFSRSKMVVRGVKNLFIIESGE